MMDDLEYLTIHKHLQDMHQYMHHLQYIYQSLHRHLYPILLIVPVNHTDPYFYPFKLASRLSL